jgi:hypothetical protein
MPCAARSAPSSAWLRTCCTTSASSPPALVTGAGGTALFGALGLLASLPMLRRLRRRFGTWRAPAIALGVFAVMFALSAFVVGPAISGGADAPAPTPTPTVGHDGHHSG